MNKRPNFAAYFIPRLQDILYIFFFYLVLILGTNLFRDGDPGRHITFGRYILSTFAIPQTDLYSYTTQGVFLPPYEWLAQVILGLSYNLLGLSGVVIVIAFLIATTLSLLYAEMIRREIPNILAVGFTLWASILTMIHWLARPHIFSLLFLAVFTPRLARLAKGENIPLWQFPLILLIWANTHGAFVFAFLIWFAFIAGNIWDNWSAQEPILNPILKKLLTSAGVSLIATLINPAGIGLWRFLIGFMGNSYLTEIASETRSVNFHNFTGQLVLISLAAIIFILSRSTRKRTAAEGFLIGGWLIIGLYGTRNVPQFAIVALPLIAEHARTALDPFPALKRLAGQIALFESQLRGHLWIILASLMFIIALASGVKFDALKQGYHFNQVEFPVEAIDWLKENPQEGHLFNYFAWGGYMIYRLWPDYPLFIDGQMIYIEGLVRDYEQILNADPGWDQKLDQYEIQWIIIPPDERLALTLTTSSAWTILHQDKTAILFRRAQP